MGGMRGFAGFLFARLFSSVKGTDPRNDATNVSSPGTPTRGMWPRVQGQANVGSHPHSAAFGGCSHQEEESPLGQHRDPPSPPGPHLSELSWHPVPETNWGTQHPSQGLPRIDFCPSPPSLRHKFCAAFKVEFGQLKYFWTLLFCRTTASSQVGGISSAYHPFPLFRSLF